MGLGAKLDLSGELGGECIVNLPPNGPTSPFPICCTYLCGELLILLLPHGRLAAEQIDLGARRQEALQEKQQLEVEAGTRER